MVSGGLQHLYNSLGFCSFELHESVLVHGMAGPFALLAVNAVMLFLELVGF